jgi:hypothetical protein
MFFKIVSDLSGAEAKPKIVPEKKGKKTEGITAVCKY